MKVTLSESQFKAYVDYIAQRELLREDEWEDILSQALGSDPKAAKAMKAAQKDLGVKKKKVKKSSNKEEPIKNGFSATDDEIIDAMGDETEEEFEDNEEEKEEKTNKNIFDKFLEGIKDKYSEDELETFVGVCTDPYSASFDNLLAAQNIFKNNVSGNLYGISQYNGVARELTDRASILDDVKEGGQPVYGYKVINGKVEPTHPKEYTGGASWIPSSSSSQL